MSTTLRAIARDMIQRLPTAIGRAETVSSLTTTTIVCNSLAFGGVSSQRFVNKWLLRRDTASSADRIRLCSDFTASSGTLTHAGTNYADTTATGETVEILEHEPYLVDNAIQTTLQRLRRTDQYILPARTGARRYGLNDLTWVEKPSDILSVYVNSYPVLSNNQEMERWNGVDSSGNLTPDNWTTTASMAMARSTANARAGDGYLVKLTRAGSTALFSQSVGLLETDVNSDSLRGDTVTVVAVVWSSVASQVRAFVNDGTTTYSSYHTGGSGWEEITKQVTVSATATKLDFGLSIETSDTPCYVARCYLVWGNVTDTVRRGRQPGQRLNKDEYRFDQSAQSIYLPPASKGTTFTIETARPYPGFDASRLVAGTADADVTDAPLVTVSTGAIGRLFTGLSEMEGNADTKLRYRTIGLEWTARFESMALAHLGQKPQNGFGVDIPFPRSGAAVRRI